MSFHMPCDWYIQYFEEYVDLWVGHCYLSQQTSMTNVTTLDTRN